MAITPHTCTFRSSKTCRATRGITPESWHLQILILTSKTVLIQICCLRSKVDESPIRLDPETRLRLFRMTVEICGGSRQAEFSSASNEMGTSIHVRSCNTPFGCSGCVHLGAVKLNSVQLLMRWELLYMLDPEIRLRLSRMALIILHFLRNRRTFHKPRDYSRGDNSHHKSSKSSLN